MQGTLSDSMNVDMGVPQGSVLGPLLFIIFINDITKCIRNSKIILYADDTAIFFAHNSISTILSTLQSELNSLSEWFRNNDLILNIKKTKAMLFSSGKRLSSFDSDTFNLVSNGTSIEYTGCMKYLGIILDPTLSWHEHIDYIATRINSRLGLLCRVRKYLSVDISNQIFSTLIQPLFEYCNVIWSNANNTKLERLIKLQKKGARILLQKRIREARSIDLFKQLGWAPLQQRWDFYKCVAVYKSLHGLFPPYLSNVFCRNSMIHNYNTRGRDDIHLNKVNSKSGQRSFSFSAAKLYNNLPKYVKNSSSLKQFKSRYWQNVAL